MLKSFEVLESGMIGVCGVFCENSSLFEGKNLEVLANGNFNPDDKRV